MLGEECYEAYVKQFGRRGCSRLIPAGTFKLTIGGKEYTEPVPRETDEVFLDRLKRSAEQGENLFAKEWPESKPIDWSDPKWASIVI